MIYSNQYIRRFMKKYIVWTLVFLGVFFIFSEHTFATQFQVDTAGTLTTGLEAYYPYESTSTDFWSTHDQINNGSTTFSGGKVGNAADFGPTNTSKWLRNTDAIGINGGAISISTWVNITTAPSNKTYTFVDVDSGASNVGFYLQYSDSNGTKTIDFARDRLCVAVQSASINAALIPGTWYHLVGTYDGSLLSLYENNILVATSTGSGTGSCNQNEIETGARNNGVTNKYSGLVDEVGVWSKALSTTEIADLYNSGLGQTMADIPLSLASLGQFKADTITSIILGASTTENEVAFKSIVNSSGINTIRLEVEVQPIDIPFTDVPNATSSFVAPGNVATAKKINLNNGDYHWQARVFESGGATSTWQAFEGNSTSIPDFIVAVPMSAYFDGDDAWAWSASNVVFDADDPFTIEFWYKLGTSQPANSMMTLMDSRSGVSKLGYLVSVDRNGIRLTQDCDGTTSMISDLLRNPYFIWDQSTSNLPTWHHVAITKNSAQAESGVKMYFDGIEETLTGSCFTSSSTDKIWFGKNVKASEGDNYFHGYLDEVRIWDIERSSSSIAANDDVELSTSTPNLRAYWRFNQTSTDLIANNAVSEQMGAPSFSTSSIFGHFILNQDVFPTSVATTTRSLVWLASTTYSGEWLGGVTAWDALGKIAFSSSSILSAANINIFDVDDPDGCYTGFWSPEPEPDEIVFNTAFAQGGASTQKTATHELGHALGLDHSYINQIMFPINTTQTVLGIQDIEDFLYFWR